jgi:hypothetical protein
VKTYLLTAFLILAPACGVDTIKDDGGDAPAVDGGGGGGGDGGTVEQDNRVTDQLQLLYRFGGAAAQTAVADTSGVGTGLDLTIADPAQVTFDAEGMTFIGPTVAQNPNPMSKVIDACKASNTISVEAWVKNAGIEGSGRIISSGLGPADHNFALKQENDTYELRLRTSQNAPNGNENYQAVSPTGTLTAVDQHVVVTRNTVGVTNFYIDGVKQSPDSVPGNFGNWDLTYGIYIGNESTLDRPWLGTIYLAAVYCKELSLAEVQQNYAEGH